jgi:GntR family transcriptional regulator
MALHSFSTRPLYLQLRDALAERIATGQWKPGKFIPNEGDLAREFGVSLGTMRRALDLMEEEHLITRRQGRGTIVCDPASDGLLNRFSKVCGTDGKPLVGRVETVNLTEGRANKAECLRLQLSDQDAVWRMCRTRPQRPDIHARGGLPTCQAVS